MPRHLATLLPIALVACGVDATEPEPALGNSDQEIFGSVSHAHDTSKTVFWEQVFANAPYGYALTSNTSYSALGVPFTTLRMFFRDHTSSGCINGFYNVDGEATWHPDSSIASCGSTVFNGDVSAVQWAPDRYDLFWFRFQFALNPHLMHVYYDGTSSHEEDLGATATQATGVPVVGSWATGHVDILWRDAANDLRRRAFDRGRKGIPGYTAGGWQLADTAVAHNLPPAPIAVAEPSVGEIDVVYRTATGQLLTTWTWDDTTWHSAPIYGAPAIDSAPALATWGSGSLMVIASSGGQLHQITRGNGWSDAAFPTDHPFANPVAAASSTRLNRVDLLATSPTNTIEHALYQESLPGFAELPNPDEANWCWAVASGMVINYMSQGVAGWTPEAACQFVSTTDGENCCGSGAPNSCHHGGRAQLVFNAYGLGWANDAILTIAQVRSELLAHHKPITVREDHNNASGGHVIVLRDTYRIGGVDYVEIADPANNGQTWVWPYTTLLTYDTNWHVDYMLSGFYWE